MFSSNTSQVSSAATYIEDVFSTWLYTGNGSTQTITNGIDLAGKGGMVWSKCRSNGGAGTNEIHTLIDTIRGAGYRLSSEDTGAQVYNSNTITAFNSTGFAIGNSPINNTNNYTYVSWTFRKQPKFFDVVTYTGNGTSQNIAHNLGSVPGCIIAKRTDNIGSWFVYHTSLGSTQNLLLNTTGAANTPSDVWNSTSPTSTQFSVGPTSSNTNGATYIAYLFAHNAGGFGLTGTDNVISCGSFTTDASGNGTFQNLGYEPQWVMVKAATGTAEDWVINDNMRGMRANPAGSAQALFPNTSGAEVAYGLGGNLSATGFTGFGSASRTYIYIAIRRGPMKTPTSGTSVFSPNTVSTSTATWTPNFPVDLLFDAKRTTGDIRVGDRLRGNNPYLVTSSTAAETGTGSFYFDLATGTMQQATFSGAFSGVMWNFRRAPGFFDEVCWTGDGTYTARNHNLTVAPELYIEKRRDSAGAWYVAAYPANTYGTLNTTSAFSALGNTLPTATQFTPIVQASGATYVAYLFASCPGVSKVGSYTGTGNTPQTISCGFAARFVMIKRTDSTGNWSVFDTARGMVAGTDPRLLLNSATAETNVNIVYTDPSGFQIVNSTADVNASGGTYIYLAIA